MSYWALLFTLVFIAITVFVSMWQKLGLEKEITVGTIRAAVQLLAIGYILQYVFRTSSAGWLLLIIAVMTGVASWNAAQRGRGLRGIGWRIVVAIGATEALTMALLLVLRIIPATPQYVIPLSGMTIGNAMVVAGLFINQMKREVAGSRGEIETLLALGATARQAIHEGLKRSVKASMIPTLDGMKTVGLVQLPGMMTGMIVAGADPVQAVRYQILIVFAFTTSAAVTSILLSQLAYRVWFTRDLMLKRDVIVK